MHATLTPTRAHAAPPQPVTRERLWSSKAVRAGIVAFSVMLTTAVGIFIAPASAQATCTDFEAEYGLACETHPAVKKAVLGTGGAMAVGFGFGGPMGALAGFAGAVVSSGVDLVSGTN